jgi:hypothetical protein
MATCKWCGAPIRWTETTAGRRLPIDPEPVAFGGNVVLLDPENQYPLARVLPKDDSYDGPRFLAHFTSCKRGGRKVQRRKAKNRAA